MASDESQVPDNESAGAEKESAGTEKESGPSSALENMLRRSILKRRAVKLARPLEKPATPPGRQYVIFVLSQQRFGFEVKYVEEVFQIKSFIPVPGTPPFIVGIASLRGALISIIDLKNLCNLSEKAVMGSDKTLIIRTDSLHVGVMTDEVVGLELIPDEEMQKNAVILSHIPQRFIEGVARDGTIVLDCKTVFSMDSLEVNQ